MATNQTEFIDGVFGFASGVNSGVSPLLLKRDELAFAVNVSLRGGFAKNRPAIRKVTLNYNDDAALQTMLEESRYQVGLYLRPDTNPSTMAFMMGGRLLLLTPTPTDSIVDVEDVTPAGDPNPPTTDQGWMTQAEQFLLVNDGKSLPIFYDSNAKSARRSFGNQPQTVAVTAADFAIPVIGLNVEIQITAPYTGVIGGNVLIAGAQYVTVSSRSNSTNNILGFTITLQKIFGTDGEVLPTGSNIYGSQNYNSFTTTPFTVPPKITFAQLNLLFNDENTRTSGGDARADNSGLSSVVSFALAYPGTGSVGKIQIGSQVYWVLSVSADRKTFRVLNPEPPGYNIQTFPIGTPVASVSYVAAPVQGSGNAVIQGPPTISPSSQSVVAVTQEDFTSPSLGGSVVVKISQPYNPFAIGKYVIVGNQQFQVTAVGTITTPGVNYYLTVENVTGVATTNVPDPEDVIFYPNELPPGRVLAYGLGRVAEALTDGRSFIMGDIAGGSSGTIAYNFRDSVFKVTENSLLFGGGAFLVPGALGDIRAMAFPATLDVSLGQGALQVFTSRVVFSCNVPADRALWQDLTSPILTQSLKGTGATGQNSTVHVNSDVWFRSPEGIQSLILGRREFDVPGNTPQSDEMERVLSRDSVSLLQFSSAIQFNNRLLMTSHPTPGTFGIFHPASISLNFDSISSIKGKLPPAYEGIWTGINVLQWLTGDFLGNPRAFALCYNTVQNKNELFELLEEGVAFADNAGNDDIPIEWSFETASLFKDIKGKGVFDLCRLIDGEMYVDQVRGTVRVQVQYRSDSFPCWTPYADFEICNKLRDEENPADVNVKPGYRTRIGLGEPSALYCDTENNKPMREFYTAQFRFLFTGSLRFLGAKFKAVPAGTSQFAKPICKPTCPT